MYKTEIVTMSKILDSKRKPVTFNVNVIRVDEYNGVPVFVVDYNGREYRVWKMPDQPDTLKSLTCELHKTKSSDGKPIMVLRQFQNNPESKRKLKKNKGSNSIGYWAGYMETHKWHRYGNEGRCTRCGSFFLVKQGWRVDMTDTLLCDNCRKLIAEFKKPNPKKKKKYARIIYTPMGNKMR